MDTSQIEVRRKRLQTGAKWALGFVGAVIISPFVFLAVKGLVGLALAFIVGTAIINFAPLVGMKFANWRLQAIKHEATVNPIETLQNVFTEKMTALKNFAESITTFQTEVSNFQDKVEGFKKTYPQDVAKFQEQLDKMKELLKLRKTNYKQASQELDLFEQEIRRASAIWDMAQAAAAMNKAAGMNSDDILEKIKTETAVDSVQKSLNRAFAELETSLIEEPQTTATVATRISNIETAKTLTVSARSS